VAQNDTPKQVQYFWVRHKGVLDCGSWGCREFKLNSVNNQGGGPGLTSGVGLKRGGKNLKWGKKATQTIEPWRNIKKGGGFLRTTQQTCLTNSKKKE